MKKETLKLEDIQGYLSHGLKVMFSDHVPAEPDYITDYIEEVIGYDTDKFEGIVEHILKTEQGEPYLHECKPILRPMDLTKPILIQGEEVISIVELAKISDEDFTMDYIEFRTKGYVTGCRYENMEGVEVVFNYSSETKSFNHFTQEYKEQYQVYDQLGLFKWLYAHHFDVENLIGRGLAVDVNTLETNPYDTL